MFSRSPTALLLLALIVVAVSCSGVNSAAAPSKKAEVHNGKKAEVHNDKKAQVHNDKKAEVTSDKKAVKTESYFLSCPQGPYWQEFESKCYRYFDNKTAYWYEAEQECRGYGGHLVSINDQKENTFVSKLTYCQAAWTGGYAVSVDQLTQPSNYRNVDGSRISFAPHDFSSIKHKHMPLLHMENMKWKNNVYHAKRNFVCEVASNVGNRTCECPVGWRSLDGNCYFMPSFLSTYIEATFFCQGQDAHVVSVHDVHELRALSLLDLDSHECPVETWIGLIKLNPCRVEYSTGKPICYKWADRSAPFNNFPAWKPGQPNNSTDVNCVYLKDTTIGIAPCHSRHKFVCKKPAGPLDANECN